MEKDILIILGICIAALCIVYKLLVSKEDIKKHEVLHGTPKPPPNYIDLYINPQKFYDDIYK